MKIKAAGFVMIAMVGMAVSHTTDASPSAVVKTPESMIVPMVGSHVHHGHSHDHFHASLVSIKDIPEVQAWWQKNANVSPLLSASFDSSPPVQAPVLGWWQTSLSIASAPALTADATPASIVSSGFETVAVEAPNFKIAPKSFEFKDGKVKWEPLFVEQQAHQEVFEDFLHRVGQKMVAWTAENDFEVSGVICTKKDAPSVVSAGTIHAYSASLNSGSMCPKGYKWNELTIHTHPQKTWKPTRNDHIVTIMASTSLMKTRGAKVNEFSAADFHYPGYLAAPGELWFQNGARKTTQRIR